MPVVQMVWEDMTWHHITEEHHTKHPPPLEKIILTHSILTQQWTMKQVHSLQSLHNKHAHSLSLSSLSPLSILSLSSLSPLSLISLLSLSYLSLISLSSLLSLSYLSLISLFLPGHRQIETKGKSDLMKNEEKKRRKSSLENIWASFVDSSSVICMRKAIVNRKHTVTQLFTDCLRQ